MKSRTAIIICTALSLPACAVTPPAQQPPAVDLPTAGTDGKYGGPKWPAGMPAATRFIHLKIGRDGLGECSPVRPHFAFDSSELQPQAIEPLKALADCLNAEAFLDRTVDVIGRADRRGDGPYNQRLGLMRAGRVKAFLIEQGVDASRIRIVTRGERDAQAEDGLHSHGWDRRADILVRGGAHRPTYPSARTG